MTSWDVARLTVRLGEHNIQLNNEVRHIERRVKRVVRHRGFDMNTLYNDIAVLTMDLPVTYSKTIRPICLPSSARLYNGKMATVIGWGSLQESKRKHAFFFLHFPNNLIKKFLGGPQPAVLQEVSIPIWSNAECRNKYGPAAPGGIIDSMICAGKAARDSCSVSTVHFIIFIHFPLRF